MPPGGKAHNEYNTAAAFAVASLLALLALLTLGIKTFMEWRQARDFARAQSAVPEPERTFSEDTSHLIRPPIA
jgi:sulfate transport system permease protein